jgi:hypothetical protein
MRRAFGTRGSGPAVCFTAAAGTLNVKARFADIAVEYSEPTSGSDETLWLPFQVLDDCAAKRDEPVHVEVTGKDRCTAQWRDGNVPQIVQYDCKPPADAEKFPVRPETFAENKTGLLEALTAASDTCDPDSTRYALGHLQLRGEQGTIVATDGRQLLVHNGFQFPWTGDLLVPRSKTFTSTELPHDLPVQVGKTENWVAIGIGRWMIHMAINVDGRFPDVTWHIPQINSAKTRCSFSPDDADFLAETLPKLPCDDDCNRPVTLDLNGQVVVRAKPSDSTQSTEVVLTGSSFSGEPIRLNMNRNYLARAMQMGLRELSITSDKMPLACVDDRRQYVWMPLDPESAIPPANNAIRIVPGSNPETLVTHPPIERKVSPVPEPITNQNGNGHTSTNGHASRTNGQLCRAKTSQQDIVALIEQAEKLRTALHGLMCQAGGLVKALKQHRRQNRAVQNTLASLRQLKTLGV